ncbi:MAG: exopolysaccharide biosynthesis polyprenyl glycosylphosphotransferase [Pseudomonadota bacterium]
MHETTRHEARINLPERLSIQRMPLFGSSRAVASTMLFSDILAISIAFAAAMFATQLASPVAAGGTFDPIPILVQRAPEFGVLAALTVAVLSFGGLYRRESWEIEEIRKICLGIGLVAVFDVGQRFTQQSDSTLVWSLVAWPMVAATVLCSRMLLRAMPSVRLAMTSNMVIVGSAVSHEMLRNQLRNSRANAFRLLGELPMHRLATGSDEILDAQLRSIALAADIPVDALQILLAPSAEEQPLTDTVIERLNKMRRPFTLLIPYDGLARRELTLHKAIGADFVVGQITHPPSRGLEQLVKRAIDLVLTTIALVVLSPLLIMLSALLMTENGPVFFGQMRVGRDGRRFRCLKFRTMLPNAEARLADLLASDSDARAEWAAHQKLTNDPRITSVGRFLRATSLDELPQLFNVLRGEMSLVGPRPIVAPEVVGYPSDHAYFHSPEGDYYRRCKPGITGLWQVSGRARTKHDERVRLDRWYARNWSIWLDLVILIKTFRAVIARTGS